MRQPIAEALPYGVAAIILVVFGAVLRTAVLNWFVGPAIVVVSVAVLHPILTRRQRP